MILCIYYAHLFKQIMTNASRVLLSTVYWTQTPSLSLNSDVSGHEVAELAELAWSRLLVRIALWGPPTMPGSLSKELQ